MKAGRNGTSLGAPSAPLNDIVGDPHLEDRNFFTPVEHPELEREVTYPGPAAIFNGSPWRIYRRAPLIGEHNQEVLRDETRPVQRRTRGVEAVRRRLGSLDSRP